MSVYLFVVCPICVPYTSTVQYVSGSDIWKVPLYIDGHVTLCARHYTFCLLIVR